VSREIWLTHETIYDFDRSVDGATVRARLRPIDDDAQTVLESEVLCHPRPAERSSRIAADGRTVERFVMAGPLRRIEIRGQTRLSWTPDAAALRASPPPRGDRPDRVPAWARPDGTIWDWASRALPDREPDETQVAAFLDMLRAEFVFDPTATEAATPVPRFFAARRGVCQDYAGLAAGCLRARDVPVRLVFGYLIRDPDGGDRFEEGQPHAWLSYWTAADGWRDADPTTGLVPPTHHLTLHRGMQLRDIQPVAGKILSPDAVQRLSVRITVVKDMSAS